MRRAVPAFRLSMTLRPGPVDAGQPEYLDAPARLVAESEPGPLGLHAAQAALGRRTGRARLVDPLPLAVAVDADRRQVADPGEVRESGEVVAEMPQHHVALEVRRDADEQVRGAGQQIAHLARGAHRPGMPPAWRRVEGSAPARLVLVPASATVRALRRRASASAEYPKPKQNSRIRRASVPRRHRQQWRRRSAGPECFTFAARRSESDTLQTTPQSSPLRRLACDAGSSSMVCCTRLSATMGVSK